MSSKNPCTCLSYLLTLGLSCFLLSEGTRPVSAQAPGAPLPPSGPALDTRVQGDLIAQQTELSAILLILQDASGLSFVPDAGVNPKVTFTLRSPTVREVLDVVLPGNGLDYLDLGGGRIRLGQAAAIAAAKTEEPDLITRTLRPENVDVSEVQQAIESARTENGRIIMDLRNNQIIVTDTPEAVAEMNDILFQLDQEVETRVFDVDYGDIEQIADELQKNLQLEDTNITADERSGRLIITAPVDILNRAEALIEQLDYETEIRIFPLKFADYELIDTILDLIEPMLSENGRAELDERTLRLIVEDTQARLNRIAKLIQQLDTPTLQVYLEVEIVAVKDTHESSFDFRMSFGDAVGTGDESVADATDVASVFPLSYDPFITTGPSGLSLFHVQSGQFRLQLEALVTENNAEVVASPRLLIQDDFNAFFNLGSEEPYSVSQSPYGYGGGGFGGYGGGSSGGIYGNSYQSQRSRDVGTILEITPHISEAGYVDMEIIVEDSTPRREDIGNGQVGLAVDKTEIDTRITVKAGRTVMLGGMVRRNSSDNRSGVPFLSKIPFLGAPFRKTSVSDDQGKLLIFITPILVNVDDPYDFASPTSLADIDRLQRGEVETGVGKSRISPRMLDWTMEQDNEVDFYFDVDPREADQQATEPAGETSLAPEQGSGENASYLIIGSEDEPQPLTGGAQGR